MTICVITEIASPDNKPSSGFRHHSIFPPACPKCICRTISDVSIESCDIVVVGVINLQLNELDSTVPKLAQRKDQILLLHCKSGLRSQLAAQRLKRQGYAKAFNLGSYSRAARLILRPVRPGL